jgi:hypothetical protein
MSVSMSPIDLAQQRASRHRRGVGREVAPDPAPQFLGLAAVEDGGAGDEAAG